MRYGWLRFLFYGVALTLLSLRLIGGDGADAAPRAHELRGDFGRRDTLRIGDIRLDVRDGGVRHVRVYVRVWCGRTMYGWTLHHLDPVPRGGTLSARIASSGTDTYGTPARYTGYLSGTVGDGAERAQGTLRIDAYHADPSRPWAAVCGTGELRWSATR